MQWMQTKGHSIHYHEIRRWFYRRLIILQTAQNHIQRTAKVFASRRILQLNNYRDLRGFSWPVSENYLLGVKIRVTKHARKPLDAILKIKRHPFLLANCLRYRISIEIQKEKNCQIFTRASLLRKYN